MRGRAAVDYHDTPCPPKLQVLLDARVERGDLSSAGTLVGEVIQQPSRQSVRDSQSGGGSEGSLLLMEASGLKFKLELEGTHKEGT